MGRQFWSYADTVGSGTGAWGLVSVISGERGTVRLAVVYIPRHADCLCRDYWTELR